MISTIPFELQPSPEAVSILKQSDQSDRYRCPFCQTELQRRIPLDSILLECDRCPFDFRYRCRFEPPKSMGPATYRQIEDLSMTVSPHAISINFVNRRTSIYQFLTFRRFHIDQIVRFEYNGPAVAQKIKLLQTLV